MTQILPFMSRRKATHLKYNSILAAKIHNTIARKHKNDRLLCF